MPKQVLWTDQARADLRGIEQPVALQILKTLARYLKTNVGDVKVIQDIEPLLFRLRAQSHRVFFRTDESQIEIVRVLDRKQAYR